MIGNLLSTRKWEVVFVTPDAPYERWIRVPKSRRSKSISGAEEQVGLAEVATRAVGHAQAASGADSEEQTGPEGIEIERLIIPELVKLHSRRQPSA